MKENRSTEDLYKTLLFLNESTNGCFFMWDMEKQIFRFAREIQPACDSVSEDRLVYGTELIKSSVSKNDRSMIVNILQNAKDGNLDAIDTEFRYLDWEGRQILIKCKGKVLRDDRDMPYMIVGCLSRDMLSDKVDMLTGFYNYNKLQPDLAAELKEKKRGHLLILGIDDFNDINRNMGRTFGTQVLKNAAEALESVRRDGHRVYKLEGDRFAIDLKGCSPKIVTAFYSRFRNAFSDRITVSAGAAAYPQEEGDSANSLIIRAENAMEQAKAEGKNKLVFYKEGDSDDSLASFRLKQEMWRSIQNGCSGFELYYQPQVTAGTHKLYGAEALLRYHSEKYGFLSPAGFIPVLEDTGLIVDVGRWIMKTAFAQCAKWRRIHRDFHVSINLSYIQLRDKNILGDILEAMKEAELPGEAVTLEVTESMQLRDYIGNNSIFGKFRESGIRISIDDFGTGYSSLSYLKNLEVDEVKIDRCFIHQIHKSAYGYRLLTNILELTHGTTIQVCCEGVEEKEELQCIDSMAPELIQGYIFGRPLPAEEFERTRLVPDENYNHLLEELRADGRVLEEQEKWQSDEIGYREILNHIKELIYVVDMEKKEICYMNSRCKKLTGVYNYHGRKCYDVLYGRSEKCENCGDDKCSFSIEETEEMFYQCYGIQVLIAERPLEWKNHTVSLVNARILGEEEGLAENKLAEGMKLAVQIGRMYETAAYTEELDGLINAVIRFTGQYYDADRAELFLLEREHDMWTDCYYYLDQGVMTKARYLESAPTSSMEPWIRLLNNKKAIFTKNGEHPEEEFGGLAMDVSVQKLHNFMLCGLWDEHGLAGMLCLDNVGEGKESLVLLKKSAELIQGKLFACESENKITERREAVNSHGILSATRLGLWQIRINLETQRWELFSDSVMRELLGEEEGITPEAYFDYWKSGISSGYNHYVNNVLKTMIASGKIIEMEYTWRHPVKGPLIARCVGVRTAQSSDYITLEGYFRINDDMERVRSVAEGYIFEHLEFHENRQVAFFHTNRSLIYGSDRKVEGFPKSWVDEEIVHPDYGKEFMDFFTDAAHKHQKQSMRVKLMNKERQYVWFRVEAYHLGRNKKDLDSMLVVMVPDKNDR